MTAYAVDYEGDLGRTYHAVRVYSDFEIEAGQQTALEPDVLPPSFSDVIQSESVCSLRFPPRRVVMHLSDVERFILPIPFRGGTDAYKAFLAEVEANPLVKAIDIRSEGVKPYQVLLSLGRVG